MNFQKPRGTFDLFSKQMELYNKITNKIKAICFNFNFKPIETPIFEHKELFVRNIGINSDIVSKEFYEFKDKSNRDLVLRPENTIGVIRCVVENKLLYTNPLPLKYYYLGPMFRYERPQAGRYRQFYQFGVEVIGIKNIYEQIESIVLCESILKHLNIKNYLLKINYLGKIETRNKWINALKLYFEKYKDLLTPLSLERLAKNPLRILDDKIDGKKDFVINCPKITSFLDEDELKEWNQIKHVLDLLKIKYEFNQTLVRGLDYYTGIVYEYISLSKQLVGQDTFIGGGKYSNLTKELGASNYDCIGFAIGIERLLIAYSEENQFDDNNQIDVYVAILGELNLDALKLLTTLRNSGFKVETNFNYSKLDKHFKYCEKFNPKVILILDQNTISNKQYNLKIQTNRNSIIVAEKDLTKELKVILSKY